MGLDFTAPDHRRYRHVSRSADIIFSGKAGFDTLPPGREILEHALDFLRMLVRDIRFLFRVGWDVVKCYAFRFPLLGGRGLTGVYGDRRSMPHSETRTRSDLLYRRSGPR